MKNTGGRAGEEVAQVYFRDRVANVVRPVKELVGFKRVALNPGEDCTLEFTVDMRQLGFYDREMNFIVEPGMVDVYVGSSSTDIRLTGEFEIAGKAVNVKGNRAFSSTVRLL